MYQGSANRVKRKIADPQHGEGGASDPRRASRQSRVEGTEESMQLYNTDALARLDLRDKRAGKNIGTETTDLIAAMEAERNRKLTPKAQDEQKRLCFAFTRWRAVNAILAYDHQGPCRTDDGEVYFDLMLPYAVEAYELWPKSTYQGTYQRFRDWLPKLCADLGHNGYAKRWDETCELRSLARGRRWLPSEDQIVTETRLTREKRAAITAMYPERPPLRGLGVIDPLSEDEKREANKLRMRTVRLDQGMIPQAERKIRADDIALAKLAGCTDRTIRSKRLAGTLDAYLAKRGVFFPKVCAPYNYVKGDAQIWENSGTDVEADAEGMAVLLNILADPYVNAFEPA